MFCAVGIYKRDGDDPAAYKCVYTCRALVSTRTARNLRERCAIIDSSRTRKCDRSDVRVTEGRLPLSSHCCVGSSGTKCSVVFLTVVIT